MKAGRQDGSHCAHCTGSKQEGDLVRRFSLMSLVSAPIALALEKKIKKAKKPRKVQIEKAFSPFGHGLESSTSLRSSEERLNSASARKFSVQETVPLLILLLLLLLLLFLLPKIFWNSWKKLVGHILLPSAS